MLATVLTLAARSPTRRKTFQRIVLCHVLIAAAALAGMQTVGQAAPAELTGHVLLVAAIVEGALLLGWRLTQLPKSQALEFLLVTPIRPAGHFLHEALVGWIQLTLVTFSGLPLLMLGILDGLLRPADLFPLLAIPWSWGAAAGLGLAVWAYESAPVRRWGEKIAMALILVYLVVGVLAGENLRAWLAALPDDCAAILLHLFTRFHTDNPFGVMRYCLNGNSALATSAVVQVPLIAAGLIVGFACRAAWRMHAHFHELHYQPLTPLHGVKRVAVGNRPLTWWAVKRVGQFSGRVNLWLAGGFGLLYAAYLIAGDAWPAWLGRIAFEMCDQAGGVPALTTGLVLLAAVPAAFQYGLWDSSVPARCRRLELLLLTELGPRDYWHAAGAAAWNRGRGYFVIAGALWVAGVGAGRLSLAQALAAAAAGVLLWSLYFALGFGAFARGVHANRLGMALTVGLPLLLIGAERFGWPGLAAVLPPGMVFAATSAPIGAGVVTGAVLAGVLALIAARYSLRHGDTALRRWYDRYGGAGALR